MPWGAVKDVDARPQLPTKARYEDPVLSFERIERSLSVEKDDPASFAGKRDASVATKTGNVWLDSGMN